MSKPAPWSFSSISTFITCPRKYHAEYVLKQRSPPSQEMAWGTEVHKIFEKYVETPNSDQELPSGLTTHQPYLDALRDAPGKVYVERPIALNTKLEPCGSFDKNVWYRGVVDYENVQKHGARVVSHIVDYKTGKMKPKPLQLQLNILHSFQMGATEVHAEFYWTQFHSKTPLITRSLAEAKAPLLKIIPDLKQYAEAWKEDIWQPRRNGLCQGYCGVTTCEFHGAAPRRHR